MKYIITEEQSNRLEETILKYLDNNLTPYDGWEPNSYKKRLKRDGDELFLFLENPDGLGEHEHMYYATCEARDFPDNDCPIVLLPDAKKESLDGFFGNFWEPIFLKWFEHHSGLPINDVDNLGW